MFNFLKGKKSELSVTLDRLNGIYYLGETVNVNVDIQPKRELELVGVRVQLRGLEGRAYKHTVMDSSYQNIPISTENTSWDYTEFFTGEERALDETTLPGGTLRHYSFQMNIPSDASPSFVGEDLIVRWQIIVKLMGRYLEKEWLSETELSVQSPPKPT